MRWTVAILVAFVALLVIAAKASAFPHIDKPGYHHCPASAKAEHRCHEGDSSAGDQGTSEDSAIRRALRGEQPQDDVDRETFALVHDYERWLHGNDRRTLRIHRAQRRESQCRHAHELYIWRHGLRGPYRNDCRGWVRDARWHERHPVELSTFLGIGV